MAYELYAYAQKQISDLLSTGGAVMLYVVFLILLRFASLVVKATGEPYAYKAYTGTGGRSLSRVRNSEAGTRPTPRLLILKN